MTFADKLIRLRKINGMSQEDLADELGVSRQAISKWEGMLSVPDLQNVLKISELFNVSTDYLLKDEIEDESVLSATDDASGVGQSETYGSMQEGGCVSENASDAVDNNKEQCSDASIRGGFAGSAVKTDKNEGVRDKGFAVAACIMLLSLPIMAITSGTQGSDSAFVMLKLLSMTLYMAIGVLTAMSLLNKKFLNAAFCVLLVEVVVNIIQLFLISIGEVKMLYRLLSEAIMLAFAIITVIDCYSGGKIRINKYVMLWLPVAAAIMNIVVSLFVSWGVNTNSTLPFGIQHIAYFLMASILFRENGYKKSGSENIGLAGVTLLILSAAISIVYMLCVLFGIREYEFTVIYYYVYAVMYVAGLVFLPWFAFYTPKHIADKSAKKLYFNIIAHMFLTCLTCFIWHWIWMGRVTCELGRKANRKKINIVFDIILYILLPFYYIYWFYKHGRRISNTEEEKGDACFKFNGEMIAFAVVSPFIGSAIMQNRLNALECEKS